MAYLYALVQTPVLGEILMLSDGQVLTALYFVDQKHKPTIDNLWQKASQLDLFVAASTQLLEYMNGTRQHFDIPYRFVGGTLFQRTVWHSISQVPYAHTLSYHELAERIEAPTSVRAVARAVGQNPLLLIIPCHRIIGKNTALTGYAGGLERKKALLLIENRHTLDHAER